MRVRTFEAFLPALNTFEQARKNPAFEKASPEWRQGFNAVWDAFMKSVSNLGIEWQWSLPQAEDQKFDPYTHEILEEIPTDDPEKDHVISQVYRSGYRVGDRVIQPAQVSVYIYKV